MNKGIDILKKEIKMALRAFMNKNLITREILNATHASVKDPEEYIKKVDGYMTDNKNIVCVIEVSDADTYTELRDAVLDINPRAFKGGHLSLVD